MCREDFILFIVDKKFFLGKSQLYKLLYNIIYNTSEINKFYCFLDCKKKFISNKDYSKQI